MIQLYTERVDMKRLAETFRHATLVARSAVPHPSITGTLHECGAKLAMRERSWDVSGGGRKGCEWRGEEGM